LDEWQEGDKPWTDFGVGNRRDCEVEEVGEVGNRQEGEEEGEVEGLTTRGEEGGCENMVWKEDGDGTGFSAMSMLQKTVCRYMWERNHPTPGLFKLHTAIVLILNDPGVVLRRIENSLIPPMQYQMD
jgi:hypothetical protein